MRDKRRVPQAMVPHAMGLLPAAGTTLHWDGGSEASRDVRLVTVAAPASPSSFRVHEPRATAPRARPYWTTAEMDLVPTVPGQAIAWEQEAARVTFALTPVLLADTVRGVIPSATGELVWGPWQGQTASPTPSVHPVLLAHAPDDAWQGDRITIVPALPVQDPLHRHLVLVLQTAVAAASEAEQLYAAALVEALVVHFLRRYAASWPALPAAAGGLTPYKLQRMLAYIQAHLADALSLTTLATVAQLSPTHFAHVFKAATGLPPHQYVVQSRLAHAKRLLADTDLPLIEIGPQVGCMDQSHFTALFRTHVAMTPKAYRNAARRACC
jgi:AraC family transcriptional regulator